MRLPAPRRHLTLASSAGVLLFALAARAGPPADPPAGDPGRAPEAGAASTDVKRVPYIPEAVRAQITDELRKAVLAQAREEGWAAPHAIPGWLSRLRLHGDVRARWEQALFPRGNAATGEFPDFAAINAGSPFDVNFVDVSGEKYLDVDRNRTRPRLRARLALDAALAEGLAVGLRLASGENGSPVSTNQTLGASGPFSKYPVWLDRAFVRLGSDPAASTGLALVLGRLENPFVGTPLVWSDNVGFDGAALRGSALLGAGVRAFLSGGAFPIAITSLAYPAERPDKLPGRNKWLFAGQFGAEWRSQRAVSVQLAAAYYDYFGVEGRLSGSCDTHLKATTCDTDDTRPLLAQKGNTYRLLRTPSEAALVAEAVGTVSRYQYFGLATAFRELVGTGRLEVRAWEGLKLALDGEVAWNQAFSRNRIDAVAINNRGASQGGADRFVGGPLAFLGRLAVGSPVPDARWAWGVSFEVRRIESDAVLDALNDSDFGLGGTNLKGVVLGASLGLGGGVVATARWSSADSVAGPRYAVDVLQVDLAARF